MLIIFVEETVCKSDKSGKDLCEDTKRINDKTQEFYDRVWSVRNLPKLQMNILTPYSGKMEVTHYSERNI
jgi:hypothetical protein